MDTEELKRTGVRQLRKICKENGKKNYAWLKKVELIFLLQDFSKKCGNCDKNLNAQEMAHYLEDMKENGGLNIWDDYVACCEHCLEWEIDMCFRCGTFYIHDALAEAETPDTGETLYICDFCSRCVECDENVYNIKEDNWIESDENYYTLECDECVSNKN